MGDSDFLTTEPCHRMMNAFQEACSRRIDSVLSKYDLSQSTWLKNPGARDTFYKDITFEGVTHTIALFPDFLNMTTTDGRLFEVFLCREFRTQESIIDGFTRRLDSYLSHGSWEELTTA